MNLQYLVKPEMIALGVTFMITLNVILIKLFTAHMSQKRITLVKNSLTGEKIRGVIEQWKQKVHIEYLADSRIKLSYSPDSSSVVFYVQEENGRVIISDHGEFIKKIDLCKTSNKGLLDKLSAKYRLSWNGSAIFIVTTLEALDEDMWDMFGIMVTLENMCY